MPRLRPLVRALDTCTGVFPMKMANASRTLSVVFDEKHAALARFLHGTSQI